MPNGESSATSVTFTNVYANWVCVGSGCTAIMIGISTSFTEVWFWNGSQGTNKIGFKKSSNGKTIYLYYTDLYSSSGPSTTVCLIGFN